MFNLLKIMIIIVGVLFIKSVWFPSTPSTTQSNGIAISRTTCMNQVHSAINALEVETGVELTKTQRYDFVNSKCK